VSRYVDEYRGRFGVEPICKTLGASVSAYYQRRAGRRSVRTVEDERLLGRIRELHAANYYAYGYRRMWKTLRRAGEQVPRCRVQRLMKTKRDPGREAARQALAHHQARREPGRSPIPVAGTPTDPRAERTRRANEDVRILARASDRRDLGDRASRGIVLEATVPSTKASSTRIEAFDYSPGSSVSSRRTATRSTSSTWYAARQVGFGRRSR
jgi:hypothetical protein